MPASEERNFNSLAAAAAVAVALLAFLNWTAVRFAPVPFPRPDRMRLAPQEAARTAGFLTLGMRRLAADLSFVELLMYYGETETGVEEWKAENGMGRYPELKDRTLRLLDLDPYFTYAALYSAGSLAFNLERYEEALEVLRAAQELQPKEWKYRAYSIAIAFKTKGDPEGVLRELMPVAGEPDCPSQLKSMLAFLNLKLGHREAAVALYRDILASRDPNYVDIARHALRKMGAAERP